MPKGSRSFHDVDEYERLVDAARQIDSMAYVIVLLGGEAGLREPSKNSRGTANSA